MDIGKLPNEMLSELLARVQRRDPRVVMGPGIGRDAAVIDAGGPKLLVAKSDPITFASDLIGWYAVHVNANDVACMGARPAWFLATILLPEGASRELAETVFGQVLEACEAVRVHAMHDPTEGGLATALYELAEAAGVGIEVEDGAIEVLPQTRALCEAAGLEAMGLLASGALLLAVAEEDGARAVSAIKEAGVTARRIGRVAESTAGVIISSRSHKRAVPRFARDEVARFLAEGEETFGPGTRGRKSRG